MATLPAKTPLRTRSGQKRSLGKGVFTKCGGCGNVHTAEALSETWQVCGECGHHHPIKPADWQRLLLDGARLERWDEHREYDRLGLDEKTYELFGVKVPFICMPVAPGRNLSTLVEVAARNQLLRSRGLNAARDLVERLERQLQEEENDPDAEEDPHSGEPQ